MSSWFSTWDVPDKYTVVLKSDKPRPGAFDLLEYLAIADEATLESPGGDQKINGTGPWTLADRKVGASRDFVKSKNYWRTGRPYLDGFHVDLYDDDDAQAKTVAFESGAADILEGAALRDIARFEQEKKYSLVACRAFCTFSRSTPASRRSTRRPLGRRSTTPSIARASWTRFSRAKARSVICRGAATPRRTKPRKPAPRRSTWTKPAASCSKPA
jgi:hypothetical protein